MDSQAHLRGPKACQESKSANQHIASPDVREGHRKNNKEMERGHGNGQNKEQGNGRMPTEGKSSDAIIQPKAAPVITSPTTSKTLLVQASTAKQTAVTSPVTTSKIPAKQAVLTEGLTLPLQTTVTAGSKLKSPSSGRAGELKAIAKSSPKNLHKTTSASQLSMSVNSPKSLQKTASAVVITCTDSPKIAQRLALSQIPRATSSPKQRPNSTVSLTVDRPDVYKKTGGRERVHSLSPKLRSMDDRANHQGENMQHPGTEPSNGKSPQRQNEDEKGRREKHREMKGGEDVLRDTQMGGLPKGSDLTRQVAQDRKLQSPGATTPSASQLKEAAGMTQERECVTEKRKREERENEEREKERVREKMKEKREEERRKEEQEKEEKRKEREKEERKRKESERERLTDMEKRVEREKKISKIYKDASTMTTGGHSPVRTLALGQQIGLGYVDAAVQAVVEVSSKSTAMSPVLTLRPWGQADPDLSNHGKTSGNVCMSSPNGFSPDGSSESDWLSGLSSPTSTTAGAKPKFLGPPPYKSPNSCKSNHQHMCQIEIELRSQSSLSESLALSQVTVTPMSRSGLALPGATEKDSKASLVGIGLETEAEKAEKGPPLEVVWDEQGMTWEVYGAAVDMESLGFAIQNHLQKKIREQEQRIGTLRKSISLSEHSPPYGKGAKKKKKKRNVFHSLFHGAACCSKAQAKAEAAQ